ncbi:MAG: hypothetical protein ACFFD3_03415 [Candidatus Thorarchaeota archaeon]
MSVRVKRAIDIMISNYDCILGACAFTYERKLGFSTENMQLSEEELNLILRAWAGELQQFTLKYMNLLVALNDKQGLVTINPQGATSLVMGTGKGIWYVCAFVPMDQDKFGIMNECVQAAKNLETSVSIFEI